MNNRYIDARECYAREQDAARMKMSTGISLFCNVLDLSIVMHFVVK
jgi:hypothetical protein